MTDVSHEAGFVKFPAFVDPGLAADFTAEQTALLSEPIVIDGLVNAPDVISSRRKSVYSWGRSTESLVRHKDRLPAASSLLDVLQEKAGVDLSSLEQTIFNVQAPGGEQEFHPDRTCDPVVIVSGGDGGAIDYAEHAQTAEEAMLNYKTIELEAGDLVFQYRPGQFHRGRNASGIVRVTVVVAKVDRPQY